MARASKIDIICATCGGNNVSRDAWANWDTGTQQWVLGTVFEYGHCHDCESQSRLEEARLPDEFS